eukprot:gene5026-10065_t
MNDIMVKAGLGQVDAVESLLMRASKENIITDKLRAECMEYPIIIQSHECMKWLFANFNPFAEGAAGVNCGFEDLKSSVKRQGDVSIFGKRRKCYPANNESNANVINGNDVNIARNQAHGMVAELKALIVDSRSQSHKHYLTLERSSKILTWRGEMMKADVTGSISNETVYKVRLTHGIEIDGDDSSNIITIAISEPIQMKIVIEEGTHRSEWITATRTTAAS